MDDKNVNQNESQEQELKLDDARRVKVLSPSMLVFKRFVRNKLAITGAIILIVLFIFSFVGGWISPYKQQEVFYGTETIKKDYATAIYNTDLRLIAKDGFEVNTSLKSRLANAVSKGDTTFTAKEQDYSVTTIGDGFYVVGKAIPQVKVLAAGKMTAVTPLEGVTVSQELNDNLLAAIKANAEEFTAEGNKYVLEKQGKEYTASITEDCAVASMYMCDAVDAANSDIVNSFDFRLNSETALVNGQSTFECNGVTYGITAEEDGAEITDASGARFASLSTIAVETAANDIVLTSEFKDATREAIIGKVTDYSLTVDGETVNYRVNRVNANYYIQADVESTLILMYADPSSEHWLGTDGNGMDLLTRLMYGGRISLIVGFVVVLLENLLGVIIGGISGYFGGVVDTILMRFVDIFNAIPFYPMALIAGSVMDNLAVSPVGRMFALMAILGILGWTGTARIVRGQILTLREQDFMIATEATGISPSRRIFKHLVPNVMPLLIVNATSGLGSIIITEATLSYLGLGLKYPLASWGSILNAANDMYVMTYYWFIWIPAGILIVLAVLGFNFIGDGLRDAFDPKMKR